MKGTTRVIVSKGERMKTVVAVKSPSAEWWAVTVARMDERLYYEPQLLLPSDSTWEGWTEHCARFGFELRQYLDVVRNRDEVLFPAKRSLRGIWIRRATPFGREVRTQ